MIENKNVPRGLDVGIGVSAPSCGHTKIEYASQDICFSLLSLERA